MKFLLPKFLIVLLIFACTSFATAQEMPEDASNEEILKFVIQHKLSNPELAKKYVQILLEKSEKSNDIQGVFDAHFQSARIAMIEGNYLLTITYCDLAITDAQKLKNEVSLAASYLTKGTAIIYLGDNKKALEMYLKALDIANQLNNIQLQIKAKANIAKIKRRMEFYDEALEIYKTNVALAEQYQFEDQLIAINSYMGVGGTFLRLQQPDSTLVYSEKGLQKSLAINDLEGVSYFYIDIGIAHFIKGNFETAIDYLQKAEKITKGLNNQTRLTEIYYYIGKSYFELEKYENAISFLQKVETIVTKTSSKKGITFNPPELLGTYLTLSKAFELTEKRELFLEYTSKYLQLRDTNENQDIEVIKELYETVKKENNSLSSRASQLKSSLIYVLLFSVFVLGLCIYFLYKFLNAKKQNKVIFEKLVSKVNTPKVEKPKPEFNIEDKKVEAILERLDKLEESLFFLNSNCTLQSLSKKVKTNTNYLSKIINKYKEKKFYEYLNDLRIQYVLKRLNEDPKFRKYSIKHIAEEIGYKSTNSFTKYFKASTKLYPSYYIKNLDSTAEKDTSN